MKTYIIFAIVNIFALSLTQAKSLTTGTRPDFSLSGHLPGVHAGRLQVTIYDRYSLLRNQYDQKLLNTNVNNGHFSLHFNGIENTGYVSIQVPAEARIELTRYDMLPVEQYDSINVQVLKDGEVYFTGRGAAKYNCLLEVKKINYESLSEKFRKRQQAYDYNDNYQRLVSNYEILDSIYARQCEIIARYKPQLSKKAERLLKIDLFAQAKSSILKLLILTDDVEKSSRPPVYKFYQEYIAGLSIDQSGDPLLEESAYYADYVYTLTRVKNTFTNNYINNYRQTPSFTDIYNTLTHNYAGTLRDKLLAIAFANSFEGHGYQRTEDYLDSAISLMPPNAYKDIVTSYKKSNIPGVAAYNFSLPDSSGIEHRLEDYKGKVVIIDFWFKGCRACLQLHEYMAPVYRHFGGRTDVRFVNINVDSNREKWIASLLTGEYTHPSSQALYTAGQGFNHPLIKHYQFAGMPQLLIIDPAGKLITAAPQRPSLKPGSAQAFIDLIEGQLKNQTEGR